MTTETETSRGRIFVTSFLPWLAAAGMLLVYLLTLNHFPNLNNIDRISELNGWYAPRRFFAPLTFILTYPLHWLPFSCIEPGLKLFTAVCAVLTLALLARSVALLPHDRTHDQRQRELSANSLLSIPAAWLPPLFAVLVCGLQMSFWENAVNTSLDNWDSSSFGIDAPGQMLDLFLFAYSIRCLLEYRISMRESWVARFAFAYSLGMANNWMFVMLFPGFLAAIIWIRGFSFFNARFLGTIAFCGFAGLSLILLFPILTSHAHLPGFGFWQVLRFILRQDKSTISSFNSDLLLLFSLTSLLPIFVISIRWASYFGESSQVGIFLATFTFHVVHAIFLLACIWVVFDPPFSPRQKAYTHPMLPLYYLAALSIGYFAGYFLLVFGIRPPKERRRPHPVLRCINFAVTASIWMLAVAVPIFLVWINWPQLRVHQATDAAFARLSSLTAQSLPARPAVVLSDDRHRLLLLQDLVARQPGAPNHLFLDTYALKNDSAYLRKLEKKHPEFDLAGKLTNSYHSWFEMIYFLEQLSHHHDIYYIHPSFGEYFERFYMEPRGLAYQLKLYDTNTWEKPALTTGLIEENQKFWNQTASSELVAVTNLIDQPKHGVSSPLLQYFMNSGHLDLEPNSGALVLGAWYSHSLDYWGVELERGGLLADAGTAFQQALELNSGSVAARVNSQFNQDLRAGKKIVVEPPAQVRDQFGRFRNWTDLLNTDGPFDDPSFCFVLGVTLAAGENYHFGTRPPQGAANYLQAIHELERVRALAPDYPDAAYWLCQLFLRFKRDSQALDVSEQVLQRSPDDPNALYYKGVSLMELRSFDKALVPLNRLLSLQTNNYAARQNRAISHLELHDYPAAKSDYEALATIGTNDIRNYYGLQEIAFHEKDTNALIKYLQLYLTNYYQYFPTNRIPPDNDEIKLIKQRLKESTNGAP